MGEILGHAVGRGPVGVEGHGMRTRGVAGTDGYVQ